ncbi:uncharacterized protein JCM15063_003705 [Sporobolomyces koalae]|uniref:uncharacterized protein n=1 Tax=Sporobolomyces koalae TaxID=500713 RepID=UPI00317B27D5
MFSYISSFFSSAQPGPLARSGSDPQDATNPATESEPHCNPAQTERNRKKRLAKKKSKQKRRESTLNDQFVEDEDFPDADDDSSYMPVEPDNMPMPARNDVQTQGVPTLPIPSSAKDGQPSQLEPAQVMSAVSRLPPLLPNGERLPNDERAKQIIVSKGFVPVEDEDGGLHVGVKVREGVVAVMGKDGPLLFHM